MSRFVTIVCDSPHPCGDRATRNAAEIELTNDLDEQFQPPGSMEDWLRSNLVELGWIEREGSDASGPFKEAWCPTCLDRERSEREATAFAGCGLTNREAR